MTFLNSIRSNIPVPTFRQWLTEESDIGMRIARVALTLFVGLPCTVVRWALRTCAVIGMGVMWAGMSYMMGIIFVQGLRVAAVGVIAMLGCGLLTAPGFYWERQCGGTLADFVRWVESHHSRSRMWV